MTFDFSEQLAIGQEYEALLDKHLSEKNDLVPVPKEYELRGIDRFLRNKETQLTFSVQYKADKVAGRTGNLFLELFSRFPDYHGPCERDGWFRSIQAQILAYYVVDESCLYWFDVVRLKLYCPKWLELYRMSAGVENSVQHENKKFWAFGLVVPLKVAYDNAGLKKETLATPQPVVEESHLRKLA